ncbi:hypothetical protein F5I97DRAFT_1980926 [Phlebopus sp. FC_14]|nr:hypothetical protein F5I97DRAFT_1980926 [Phlebopus sp. FC_14]
MSSYKERVSLSSTAYKFAKFIHDEENEVAISDLKRLAAFYPNATCDFYGTPSSVLCIYKTGAVWPVRTGPESQRIIREARGTRFSELLIWIGVKPGSLEYNVANYAADAVTYFLDTAGFTDFEIGFRESIMTRSVSGPKMLSFEPFTNSVPEFRKPFTPTLGLGIAPFKTPHFEGTGTIYICESRDSDHIFLVTCAHVARPPPVFPSNKGLVRKTKSHPREHVIALGNSGYSTTLRSMMGTIGDLAWSMKDWQNDLRRLGDPKEGEDKKIPGGGMSTWACEVAHIGPKPVGVGVEPHHHRRNWALIELYNDKFYWDSFKGDKATRSTSLTYSPAGGSFSPLDYRKLMFPRPEDQANYEYPEDGLLQVYGVVPFQEIYNPQHLDANGEQCLLVVKNGLMTGTTTGRVTGMESFTRTYKEHGISETLPYGNLNGPFSAPGDSGSLVLDRNGRILGILTGGADTTNETDVTYLTHWLYIEEDIRKYFPDFFLYEVAE